MPLTNNGRLLYNISMNTLQKVYNNAKVGVAIFFQIYGVSSYLPQVHTPTPIAIVQQQKTGAGGNDEKSMVIDTAAGFLRVKFETAYLECLKQEERVGNDKPLMTYSTNQLL